MKVYFTVDVEVWPGGWNDIDTRFPQAFQHYVYGKTAFGQDALPLKLRVLRDHGLRGVFFVEPLFSARFGLQPLQEIVGLIREGGQEVQLHLHTEWVDEARMPLLSVMPTRKMQHISYFGLEDQVALIGWGKNRLREAGAPQTTAFRAGSFVFNRDTLRALERNDIFIDSSYNECYDGAASGIWRAEPGMESPLQPFMVDNVQEFPVTVYRDRPLHLRPLQLQGCSLGEITTVLRGAAERDYPAVVIVSHNFELLDRRDFSRDEIVTNRFLGLCDFLSRNSDAFETSGFHAPLSLENSRQPSLLKGAMHALCVRYVEQVQRRL